MESPILEVVVQPSLQFGPLHASLWVQILLLSMMFILGFDGLGKELGWRGYALPKLLTAYSALAVSLLLGAFWALWHLPYAMTVRSTMSGQTFLSFLPGIFASSILLTWIFNHTPHQSTKAAKG